MTPQQAQAVAARGARRLGHEKLLILQDGLTTREWFEYRDGDGILVKWGYNRRRNADPLAAMRAWTEHLEGQIRELKTHIAALEAREHRP